MRELEDGKVGVFRMEDRWEEGGHTSRHRKDKWQVGHISRISRKEMQRFSRRRINAQR